MTTQFSFTRNYMIMNLLWLILFNELCFSNLNISINRITKNVLFVCAQIYGLGSHLIINLGNGISAPPGFSCLKEIH